MSEETIAWIILAAFFSIVGLPGYLSFLGIDEPYWKLWIAGHIALAALVAFIGAVCTVYWALCVVLT